MAHAYIRVLGQMSIRAGNRPVPPFPTRSAAHLFAFLLLHRDRWTERDVLSGTLWGERTESAARKALRSALWRIRRTLKENGVDPDAWFQMDAKRVRFVADAELVRVDAHEFEAAACRGASEGQAILPQKMVDALEDALLLYGGDLLPSVFEEWAFLERERLHLRRIAMLDSLVNHYQAVEAWRTSLYHAQAIVRADPLREPAHRAIMRAYQELGDRPSAIRQHRRLRRILKDELAVEPMPETEGLYRWILGCGSTESRLPPSPPNTRLPHPELPHLSSQEHGRLPDR